MQLFRGPRSRHKRLVLVAGVLAACSVFPSSLFAITAIPTANGWGADDYNTSTLTPFGASYQTFCPWVAQGVAANATFSNAANWSFRFAQDVGLPNVPSSVFNINVYSAWVVTHDAVTDPGGTQRRRPVTNADAGGANWVVTYVPRPDPDNVGSYLDPTGINFLQVYREILTFNDGTEDAPIPRVVTRYRLDGFSGTSPFYEANGINGNLTNSRHWMYDTPYDCEESGTPTANGTNIGASSTCRNGADGALMKSDVEFQTFVARNRGAAVIGGNNVANDVILYGGEWWGYIYTNSDTPEPAFALLTGIAIFGLAWARRR